LWTPCKAKFDWARKGLMIPRYSEFHDLVHVGVKSFEVSPWFPHAVWIFGTTIGWSLCMWDMWDMWRCQSTPGCKHCGRCLISTLWHGWALRYLDRLDQRVMSCKESRNPSFVS
jgi:hypothetical protein